MVIIVGGLIVISCMLLLWVVSVGWMVFSVILMCLGKVGVINLKCCIMVKMILFLLIFFIMVVVVGFFFSVFMSWMKVFLCSVLIDISSVMIVSCCFLFYWVMICLSLLMLLSNFLSLGFGCLMSGLVMVKVIFVYYFDFCFSYCFSY